MLLILALPKLWLVSGESWHKMLKLIATTPTSQTGAVKIVNTKTGDEFPLDDATEVTLEILPFNPINVVVNFAVNEVDMVVENVELNKYLRI